jgi:hypothetical protein
MYQNTKRHEFRQIFGDIFQKITQKIPLTPMEAQIAEIIETHPEYHELLANLKSQENLDKDYTPEMGQTNPFLHIALHLSIRDQIHLDRPAGIQNLYQNALQKYAGNHHRVEHIFMESLAEVLHQAQVDQLPPNEEKYLKKLSFQIQEF